MNNTKVTCDIANDLLPLYVDGILSEESKNAVVEHLSKCKKCQHAVESMKKELDGLNEIVDKDIDVFKKVQKKIRKKYFLLTLVVVFFLFVIWVASNCYMMSYFAPVNPKAQAEYIDECLDVVKIGDAYYLHQTDFFAQGDIVMVGFENGAFDFYLGESGIHNLGLGRSWIISPQYQYLINIQDEEKVTSIRYCKPDGTVIVTLWEEGDALEELVAQ